MTDYSKNLNIILKTIMVLAWAVVSVSVSAAAFTTAATVSLVQQSTPVFPHDVYLKFDL